MLEHSLIILMHVCMVDSTQKQTPHVCFNYSSSTVYQSSTSFGRFGLDSPPRNIAITDGWMIKCSFEIVPFQGAC